MNPERAQTMSGKKDPYEQERRYLLVETTQLDGLDYSEAVGVGYFQGSLLHGLYFVTQEQGFGEDDRVGEAGRLLETVNLSDMVSVEEAIVMLDAMDAEGERADPDNFKDEDEDFDAAFVKIRRESDEEDDRDCEALFDEMDRQDNLKGGRG